MQTQKESASERNLPEARTEAHHEPEKLTLRQNVLLTTKVLGAVALLILLIWLIDKAKG